MKTKKLYYWTGGVVLCLIIWGLFGHFVCRIGYSTQKPMKCDVQGADSTIFRDMDVPKDTIQFDTMHSQIVSIDTAD